MDVELVCPHCGAKNRYFVKDFFPGVVLMLCEDDDHETCGQPYAAEISFGNPTIKIFTLQELHTLIEREGDVK